MLSKVNSIRKGSTMTKKRAMTIKNAMMRLLNKELGSKYGVVFKSDPGPSRQIWLVRFQELGKYGDKVRVLKGKYKDKTGSIVGKDTEAGTVDVALEEAEGKVVVFSRDVISLC